MLTAEGFGLEPSPIALAGGGAGVGHRLAVPAGAG
jgi:hypothetical protein